MVSKPKSAPAPNTGPADPTAPPAQPEPEPRPAEERLVSVLLYPCGPAKIFCIYILNVSLL